MRQIVGVLVSAAAAIVLVPSAALAQQWGLVPLGPGPGTVVNVQDTPAVPHAGVGRFSVMPSAVDPGDLVVLDGGGCSAHARVYFAWAAAVNPANVENIGTVTAHADGTFQTSWAVPWTMRAVPIRISAACDGRLLGSDILTVRHPTGVQVLEPQGFVRKTEGDLMTVRGRGCPPGSTVRIWYDRRQLGTTRAHADGSFRTRVRVPAFNFDESQPEAGGELGLPVTCGGRQGAGAFAIGKRGAHQGGQVSRVPRGGVQTGGGGTAGGGIPGRLAALLLGGLVTIGASGWLWSRSRTRA